MTFYKFKDSCRGTIYGDWIGNSELAGIGFVLSNYLTVFAVYHKGHLKMVGVKGSGHQEGRYKTKSEENISLDGVKQAWKYSSGQVGAHYKVKGISSLCPTGIGILYKLIIAPRIYI